MIKTHLYQNWTIFFSSKSKEIIRLPIGSQPEANLLFALLLNTPFTFHLHNSTFINSMKQSTETKHTITQ